MTPEQMRAELFKLSYDSPIVRNCLAVADRDGLSGEDRYTVLAYHAVNLVKQLQDGAIRRASMETTVRFIVPDQPIRAQGQGQGHGQGGVE